AQLRIRRARWASACAVLGRRVQRPSVSRSSWVSVNGGIGRPVRMRVLLSLQRTRDRHHLFRSFLDQDTSLRLTLGGSTASRWEVDVISTGGTPPAFALLQQALGFWISRAICVVARLGIADLLKNGPLDTETLAAAARVHAPSLYRVLRTLASVG